VTAPPLAGRLAVVAGASRGIGLAIAEALQGAGAHVVRLARSLADAEADRRTDLRCDVTRADDVARAAGRVLKGRGAPDILVHSAGMFTLGAVEAVRPDDLRGMLEANLVGPFLVLRAFLPAMRARAAGHIVTVGSVADRVPYPGNAAYAATKYGLRGLHEVLALELQGSGIAATLVSPGPTDTEVWDPVDPDNRPGFVKRRDMLRPEDVAEAVLFVVTRPPRVHVAELLVVPRL